MLFSFKTEYEELRFDSLMACNKHKVNSESSVTYPGPTLKHPPPGISMHYFIYSSSIISWENSNKEPHESPIKTPNIHPNAWFSNYN